VANACAVVAANRTGREGGMTFYGSSFIADHRGDLLAELGRDDQGVVIATLDLDAQRRYRAGFGFFRDRRPDLYRPLSDDGDDKR
jgi:N-carbamoylputrescine amidase